MHQSHALQKHGATAFQLQPTLNTLSSAAGFSHLPGLLIMNAETAIGPQPACTGPPHPGRRHEQNSPTRHGSSCREADAEQRGIGRDRQSPMRGKTASLSTTAKATFSDGSGSGSASMVTTASRTSLAIPTADGTLQAELSLPAGATGLVVFCHGSGSNRLSPRNRHVAEQLQRGGLATLLFDLERSSDTSQRHSLAALPPLQQRLLSVIDWTGQQPELEHLALALYGASTGAALALMGAAERPDRVQAVVSLGGRPDLVFQRLPEVRCPVLLLVGEHDLDVLELNAWAAGQLQVRNELVVIPQASHLFSEPGCLDAVAEHTYRWLIEQFSQEPISSAGDL